MKLSTLAIAVAIGGLSASGAALAGKKDGVVIDDVFSNRSDTQLSGSGHTILGNCGASSGNQVATLKIEQDGTNSEVNIDVTDARPNTVYTVWLRMAGSGPGGDAIGGSPMTGGGATPLAPGSALDNLIHYTSPLPGSSTPTNGFTTDGLGNAHFEIELDFPVIGGAYPFQAASQAAIDVLNAARAANNQGPIPGVRIPSPVVNPADPNISGGFLLRVISHCTDQLGHGLSPGTREAWFQYP